MAFAFHADSRVSAVVGTHTHVQTADETILPEGTAYISDVGMTGPSLSVIGMEVEPIVQKFKDAVPKRFGVAKSPAQLNGVYIEMDSETGKAIKIERVFERA